MSDSGREALPDVRDWLGGPPMSVKPARMLGSRREALWDV